MLYEASRTTGGHRVGQEDLKYFTRVKYVLTPLLRWNTPINLVVFSTGVTTQKMYVVDTIKNISGYSSTLQQIIVLVSTES